MEDKREIKERKEKRGDRREVKKKGK